MLKMVKQLALDTMQGLKFTSPDFWPSVPLQSATPKCSKSLFLSEDCKGPSSILSPPPPKA